MCVFFFDIVWFGEYMFRLCKNWFLKNDNFVKFVLIYKMKVISVVLVMNWNLMIEYNFNKIVYE